MDFAEYSSKADSTAIYPNRGNNFAYPALGLAGEAGEVCEKFKKVIRDKGGVIDDKTRDDLTKELGDVLWYINAVCYELNISLDDVACRNIEKLFSRKERNVLQGSGDNR